MEASSNPRVLRAEELELRPYEFLALAAGHPLRLTVRELTLLQALMERSGRIVAREELYRAAWGRAYRSEDRSVDVYVAKLRVKLESAIPERRFIHTHFGFGYRFDPEPRPALLPVG
ncbi:MAG TPA: helix-turn-helix domain-containing protein [Thermoleophilaceae bacterium]|nr:helix-turn-helix domain-containing protein [Thermoleophilaceae bacterium]